MPRALSEADARRVEGFRRRYDRLVADAGRLPLARLVERIVNDHDYDLAVLCRRDGVRRLANLRKLARLARRYEAVRGPSLEGFLDSVARLGAEGSREAEASVADEGGDAVRLLTVHAAKGLEFPVVVLADAGRELGRRRRRPPALLLPDGRLGLQVPDARGVVLDTPAYDEAVEHAETADAEERRRVAYVALTRARERLIVSGCIGTRLAVRALDPRLAPGARRHRAGRRRSASWSSAAPTVALRFPPLPRGGARRSGAAQPGARRGGRDRRRRRRPPSCRSSCRRRRRRRRGRSASPTARSTCTRAAATASSSSACWACSGPAAERGGRRGDARHGAAPRAGARAGRRSRPGRPRCWRPTCPSSTPPVVDDGAGARRALRRAARWRPGSRPSDVVRRELPFAFAAAGTVVRGRLDVLARSGPGALVVDYKTGRHPDEPADDVRDRIYGVQELVYALAALEGGAETVDVAFAFLDDDAVAERRFARRRSRGARGASRGGGRRGHRRPVPGPAGALPVRRLPGARPPLRGDGAAGRPVARLTPASPAPARARAVVRRLRAVYPGRPMSLDYGNAWELLVAVILSAQCTDARVNEVTPGLFRRWPGPGGPARGDRGGDRGGRSADGLLRNKTRSMRGAAAYLLEHHDGEVPRKTEQLVKVPGVGRKTAAVVLRRGLRPARGHRRRHARGPHLAAARPDRQPSIPVQAERELMAVVPRTSWIEWTHLLIYHGRTICTSRAPRCPACVLLDICPEGQERRRASGAAPARSRR